MERVPGAAPPVDPVGSVTLGTEVSVSRREVRVAFGRAVGVGEWGWTEEEARARLHYGWSIDVDAAGEPRSLGVRVTNGGEGARWFPSLAALVEGSLVFLCDRGMPMNCRPVDASARVDGGRVVVVLRDSALVAELFGMRPARVGVGYAQPDVAYRPRSDSVEVRYVDPQMPLPDEATRARAAAARREHMASIRSVSRGIVSDGRGPPLWVAVGDSATVRVEESRCRYDVCNPGAVADSGWSVADTAVARVLVGDRSVFPVMSYAVTLVGMRPGRTVVRVDGLHGSDDTALSRPPPRALEAEVVVTEPIARVEIAVSDSVVAAGSRVSVRVRVVDVRGREVVGAPVRVRVEGGSSTLALTVVGAAVLRIEGPGDTVLRASYGGREAEVRVRVVREG